MHAKLPYLAAEAAQSLSVASGVRVKRGTGIAESGMRNPECGTGMRNPELGVKRGIRDKTRN